MKKIRTQFLCSDETWVEVKVPLSKMRFITIIHAKNDEYVTYWEYRRGNKFYKETIVFMYDSPNEERLAAPTPKVDDDEEVYTCWRDEKGKLVKGMKDFVPGGG